MEKPQNSGQQEPAKRNLGGYEIVPSTEWTEDVENSDSLWRIPGIDSIYQGEPYAPYSPQNSISLHSRQENFVIPKPETTEDAESDGSELKFNHSAVATSEAMVVGSLHPQATPKTLAEATENMWRERDDETPTNPEVKPKEQ